MPLACPNFGPPKLSYYYFFLFTLWYPFSYPTSFTFWIQFSFFTVVHHFANNFWLLSLAYFVWNAFIYLLNYCHYVSVITVIGKLSADPQTLANTIHPLVSHLSYSCTNNLILWHISWIDMIYPLCWFSGFPAHKGSVIAYF